MGRNHVPSHISPSANSSSLESSNSPTSSCWSSLFSDLLPQVVEVGTERLWNRPARDARHTAESLSSLLHVFSSFVDSRLTNRTNTLGTDQDQDDIRKETAPLSARTDSTTQFSSEMPTDSSTWKSFSVDSDNVSGTITIDPSVGLVRQRDPNLQHVMPFVNEMCVMMRNDSQTDIGVPLKLQGMLPDQLFNAVKVYLGRTGLLNEAQGGKQTPTDLGNRFLQAISGLWDPQPSESQRDTWDKACSMLLRMIVASIQEDVRVNPNPLPVQPSFPSDTSRDTTIDLNETADPGNGGDDQNYSDNGGD